VWGTMTGGDNIVWSTSDGDNIVWGTHYDGDNIVWGTMAGGDNIVWGTDCGGADCDTAVWGVASDGDNIVWGTASEGDNIVWGTSLDANVIWATATEEEPTVLYPDSDSSEPLPSLALEFGDEVPLPAPSPDLESGDVNFESGNVMPIEPVAPSTLQTVTSVSIGGI
jgi:hypothetical protein